MKAWRSWEKEISWNSWYNC